jgi:hypothetical protein
VIDTSSRTLKKREGERDMESARHRRKGRDGQNSEQVRTNTKGRENEGERKVDKQRQRDMKQTKTYKILTATATANTAISKIK